MVIANASLHDAVDEILPGVIADRRHLHENPELGMQEYETAKFVAQRLESLGAEDIRTGIANTGVTALIRGTNPDGPGKGKVVMLRADMDALPIEEENDVPYKSKNPGVMHACGHDAHTAMLLGTARMLMERRDQFAGTVKLVFQPSEELPPGGAKPMIAAGVLEDPKVDATFGIHMANDTPTGIVGVRAGAMQAAADLFRIVIQGKGGHGAMPNTTVDPIVVGAQIVSALQTIVSRETNPLASAVVTVGAFHAGHANNVIPDTAELKGTVRTFDQSVRESIAQRMDELINGIAESMQASATFEYTWGYPPLINNAEMSEIVRQAATEVVGAENTVEAPQIMAGEDMSYFLNEVPGCYFMVGSKNEEKGFVWSHHHPRFDLDEESMGVGIKTMVTTVMRYFEQAG